MCTQAVRKKLCFECKMTSVDVYTLKNRKYSCLKIYGLAYAGKTEINMLRNTYKSRVEKILRSRTIFELEQLFRCKRRTGKENELFTRQKEEVSTPKADQMM